MNKNIISTFLLIDIIIIIVCIGLGNYLALINTQVSFISSLIITFATFYSYKNKVLQSVDDQIQEYNDIDTIDKIDDPYDLYSSPINEEVIENPTKEQILEARKPLKQNHLKNLKDTIFSYASFYRIMGYGLLIFGFFVLKNNNLLDIYPYLAGFLILPISSLLPKRG